jgi:hypothetical protein
VNSRKDFFKFVAGIGMYLATNFLYGKTKDSSSLPNSVLPEGEEPISETDPTVKALGYQIKKISGESGKNPDKKALGKMQICKNCYNYTALNNGWGKCTVLNKGVVSSQGWCSAWAGKD